MEKEKRGKGVVFNKERGTWNLIIPADPVSGKKRTTKIIGSAATIINFEDAVQKAEQLKRSLRLTKVKETPTVNEVFEGYRAEWMPTRLRKHSARVGMSYLRVHVLPRWGAAKITDLTSRNMERWIATLPLAASSKGHVRSGCSQLWEYAMWAELIPRQKNPLTGHQCKIPGVTLATKEAVVLTPAQFEDWFKQLRTPFNIFALVSVTDGMRGCEGLGLRWKDVDWLDRSLLIERSWVEGSLWETKTRSSHKRVPVAKKVLNVLKQWRAVTEYRGEEDYVFPSPYRLGRAPYAPCSVRTAYRDAAKAVGLKEAPGLHAMRHSCRSWMDAAGVKLTVQKDQMRHAKLDMTIKYGKVITDEQRQAVEKLAEMALGKASPRNEEVPPEAKDEAQISFDFGASQVV